MLLKKLNVELFVAALPNEYLISFVHKEQKFEITPPKPGEPTRA